MNTYLIAFESTHAAMATERALAAHVKTTMLPTPKAISAGCGMSLKYAASDDEDAARVASQSPGARGLATLYRQSGESYERVVEM